MVPPDTDPTDAVADHTDVITRLHEEGPLSEARAEAYVARRVADLDRAAAATALDKPTNTVDDLFWKAKNDIAATRRHYAVLVDLGLVDEGEKSQ